MWPLVVDFELDFQVILAITEGVSMSTVGDYVLFPSKLNTGHTNSDEEETDPLATASNEISFSP
jgi:hypothetical protein